MEKLNFETEINACPEIVWDAVVNDKKYRQWTDVFSEGSFFEGGWKKGDAIRFLIINESGQREGMVSEIAESRYPEYISIRHLGYFVNDVDDTSSDSVTKWAPAFENYTLERLENNKTRFVVEADTEEHYVQMFMELWPKALARLKEVSENQSGKNIQITVSAMVNATIEKVWEYWTEPRHITRWNQASDDWHCPAAENEPVENGRFKYTMASKDGLMSFDFEGVYLEVENLHHITYRMDDGRLAEIYFKPAGNLTIVSETFDAEQMNPPALQQTGWQAILDSFKQYIEG